jgi:hypothetical protein
MRTAKTQATPVQRRAFSINKACIVLDVCRATAYQMMRSGELPYVEYGGRRHITSDTIETLIRGERPGHAHLSPERPEARTGELSPEQIAKAVKRTKPRLARRRSKEAAS